MYLTFSVTDITGTKYQLKTVKIIVQRSQSLTFLTRGRENNISENMT